MAEQSAPIPAPIPAPAPESNPESGQVHGISVPDFSQLTAALTESRAGVIRPLLDFIREQQKEGRLDQWSLNKAIDHTNYLALVLRNGHEAFVKSQQDAAIAQQLSVLMGNQ